MNQDILKELRKPFAPGQIFWLPGSMTRDKTKAMAMAYADVRAYQNRLDEVCGMGWSTTFTPWGDRIICHLTIDGVTRSSTGEPDKDSVNNELAGTVAEGQAFKRACASFGLGRYLYSFPRMWVEFDAEKRKFSDAAIAKLNAVVAQHYKRYLDTNDADAEPQEPAEAPQAAQEASAASRATKTMKTLAAARTGSPAQPQPTMTPMQEFEALGKELYGKAWERIRKYNVEKISGGQAAAASELAPEQLQKLVVGMKSLKTEKEKVAA
jgi:hypothetical protein